MTVLMEQVWGLLKPAECRNRQCEHIYSLLERQAPMGDQQIQRVKARHLARVGLWSKDIATQARFHCQALGLDLRATSEAVTGHDPEIAEANMFLGLGEERYCLGLYNDNRPTTGNGRSPTRYSSLHHLTFEVDTAAELAALAARLKLSGLEFTLGTSDNVLDMNDS